MKIGVFGGSFNPVHKEHFNVAISAIKQFGLDKLIIMPAKLPPHKLGERILDFNHRYNMLKIAFSNIEKVEICDFEAKSQQASYTYLTLEYISQKYVGCELFFLVGTDMLIDFPTWKNTERILELATLLVTPRCGDDFEIAKIEYQKHFSKPFIVAEYQGKNISSTKIKAYYELGLDVMQFIDDKVLNYIEKNKIYVADKFYCYVKNELPQKRLVHTANVIAKAVSLARILKVDKNKAELAALLHDCAKYRKANEFPEGVIPKDAPDAIIHQFSGAYIAEKVLKIDDVDVLNAIKYHTTGRKNMSRLEQIVFIADLIEDGRDFEGVEEIRNAINHDFDKGFAFALCEMMRFLSAEGPVYYLTKECKDYYND